MEFNLPIEGKIRGDQLADEISMHPGVSTVLTVDDVCYIPPNRVSVAKLQPFEYEVVQEIIDNHEPVRFYSEYDYIAAQEEDSVSTKEYLSEGLHDLTANDKSYVLMARNWALLEGESNEEILGIFDRDSAEAYIKEGPKYKKLSKEAQDWADDMIEVMSMAHKISGR